MWRGEYRLTLKWKTRMYWKICLFSCSRIYIYICFLNGHKSTVVTHGLTYWKKSGERICSVRNASRFYISLSVSISLPRSSHQRCAKMFFFLGLGSHFHTWKALLNRHPTETQLQPLPESIWILHPALIIILCNWAVMLHYSWGLNWFSGKRHDHWQSV